MKKALLIAVCLFSFFVKAQDSYPMLEQITSNDSVVWIFVYEMDSKVVYSIQLETSGKVQWSSREGLEWKLWKQRVDAGRQDTLWWEKQYKDYDKNGNVWQTHLGALLCNGKVVHKIPHTPCKLHVRANGEVWTAEHNYVGYYHNGVFTRIFVIEKYKAQGTEIYTCIEGRNCPEEKEKNYRGWGEPTSIYFSDGRKIGYIKDPDGFVNFRTAPDTSASIIGIILDSVRIFYWDNDTNGSWYRAIVNDTEGYVHKSRIIPR